MDEFDLDRAAEVGWAGFLTRLAGHLVSLDEPLRITPYGAGEDSSLVLLVEPTPDELVAELSAPGFERWPDESRLEHLVSLGWQAGAEPRTWTIALPRSHAHLLAAVLTDTLSEVVRVPHPAFLDAGSLTISPPPGPSRPSRRRRRSTSTPP